MALDIGRQQPLPSAVSKLLNENDAPGATDERKKRSQSFGAQASAGRPVLARPALRKAHSSENLLDLSATKNRPVVKRKATSPLDDAENTSGKTRNGSEKTGTADNRGQSGLNSPTQAKAALTPQTRSMAQSLSKLSTMSPPTGRAVLEPKSPSALNARLNRSTPASPAPDKTPQTSVKATSTPAVSSPLAAAGKAQPKAATETKTAPETKFGFSPLEKKNLYQGREEMPFSKDSAYFQPPTPESIKKMLAEETGLMKKIKWVAVEKDGEMKFRAFPTYPKTADGQKGEQAYHLAVARELAGISLTNKDGSKKTPEALDKELSALNVRGGFILQGGSKLTMNGQSGGAPTNDDQVRHTAAMFADMLPPDLMLPGKLKVSTIDKQAWLQ